MRTAFFKIQEAVRLKNLDVLATFLESKAAVLFILDGLVIEIWVGSPLATGIPASRRKRRAPSPPPL